MRYVALLVLTGCGRIGFEPRGQPGDAAVDVPIDAPLPPCATSFPAPPAGLTSRYRIASTPALWFEAEAMCEIDGAHLVKIDDLAENQWVQANVAAFHVVAASAWL